MTEYTFYILQSKDKLIKPKYVGSSEDFIHRQSTHKYSCNNNSEKYNFKVYQFIRLNGGFENWEFVIIDKVIFGTKQEAFTLEDKFIKLFGTLNTYIPIITEEQKKEKKKQYDKIYKEENKEEYKQYRLEHKEAQKKYTKKYNLNHKEEINDRKKEYRLRKKLEKLNNKSI